MQSIYFESNGFQLYGNLYLLNKSVPTLLLLHGLGFHSFEYEKLAPKLIAAGFNCFSFDFKSHGLSQGTRGIWTLNDLVQNTQDAMDFLETQGLHTFGFFGNSLGATVAVFVAAIDDRVKSVVASNCATKPSVALFSPFRRGLLYFLNRFARRLRISVNFFMPYSLVLTDKNLIARVKKDEKITEARKFSPATYLEMYQWDATKVVKNMKAPILILHGNKDRLQPLGQSTMLFEAAHNPKQLKITDMGHVPNVESANELSEILIPWFRETLKTEMDFPLHSNL